VGVAAFCAQFGRNLRLHFASVYVRDQERSKRFFLDQLGFNLVTDVRFPSGNRWIDRVSKMT
jgi:catechol 2,3-dioxygenase-like lactoylglutathione lyase family enzyme